MSTSKDSVSVIIPAHNDAEYIPNTVETTTKAVQRHFNEYEIIIVNDGSTDDTGEVSERLKESYDNVCVIHHDRPHCLGGVYKTGTAIAVMRYLILVNGKNDITSEELDKIFSLRGRADMIIPYTLNFKERSIWRRIPSRTFTWLLNTLFGLRLRYFNHFVLHKKELIDSMPIRTNSYAFQAEALVKLIKRGHTYIEIGVFDIFDQEVRTKAFKLQNVLGVVRFFFSLIYDVYIDHPRRGGETCDERSDIQLR